MNEKERFYANQAMDAAVRITASPPAWAAFLAHAARLYKYEFPDQLMIHAQRPEATAVGTYEMWNTRMNRYVRRGQHAIALYDPQKDGDHIRYVFDITDTVARTNARTVVHWKIREEAMEMVTARMQELYGVEADRGLRSQLETIAREQVREYWGENRDIFFDTVDYEEGSSYNKAQAETAFLEAATASTAFMLMARAGIDPNGILTEAAFQALQFNRDPKAIFCIGSTVGHVSGQILREIEAVVRSYERLQVLTAQAAERTNENGREVTTVRQAGESVLQTDRGTVLPDSGGRRDEAGSDVSGRDPGDRTLTDPSQRGGNTSRDLRENETGVPSAQQADAVQYPDSDGRIERPSAPDGSERQSAGARNENTVETESESDRRNDLGADPGDDTAPDHQRIEQTNEHRFEQISFIDQKAESEQPSAFPVSERDFSFEYQLLDKLRSDCEYFLGYSNRAEKNLWGQSVTLHIAKMRELYDTVPAKPEWLTEDAINSYAERMAPRYLVVVYHHEYDGFDERGDYQTLTQAERIAQKYISGEMEADGFQYEGAAVYDQKERVHLRIYGDFPDANAHHEIQLEEAKKWINDFCLQEYGEEADFSDLTKVDIAYTTYDDTVPIQVSVDLVNYRLERKLGDITTQSNSYLSLEELIQSELDGMTFDELISLSDEELEQFYEHDSQVPYETAEEPLPEISSFVFSLEQEEIDHVLRLGSNSRNTRMVMVDLFQKQKPLEEIVERAKQEYHGGAGFTADSGDYAVWFGDDGLHLSRGLEARDTEYAQILSWEDAVKRIGVLLEEGNFADNVELIEAEGYVRNQLAESLWYLTSDLSETAIKQDYLTTIRAARGNNFPDDTNSLADILSDSKQRERIAGEFRNFNVALQEEPNLLRFHYHNLDRIRRELTDLSLPRRVFSTEMIQVPSVPQFITQDEIRETLRRGSNVAQGKIRIYQFYQTLPSLEGSAEFLKKEYGIGGASNAVSQSPSSWIETDGKGMQLRKANCEAVKLNWSQVARRVNELIQNGSYLTAEEKEYIVQQEEAHYEPTEEEILKFEIGTELTIEDRNFVIEEVKDGYVSLRDVTFQSNTGFPIFCEMPVEEVQRLLKPEVNEIQEEPTVFPSEKTGLPYDVVVERLPSEREVVPEQKDDFRDHPISIQVDGQWQTFPNQEAAEAAAHEEWKNQVRNNAQNYRITDDNLGVGGPKARFQANVAAIRLLRELERDGLQALPEQQEVLARYTGWGSLGDAFDPSKDSWDKEYEELQDLLLPVEYAAARSTVLNAHYTSPVIIRAIYQTVGNMGFATGNILEPSMGIGSFFGMLPDSMQGSSLYGVELDTISGRIAKQLYPNAEITISGFEKTSRSNFFDLAVGNVPFGDYKVNDRAFNRYGFSIHNYFLAKAIDQVRPGGVVAFVTSHYTMDAKSMDARRYIAQRAELLGAIRLPNNAFKGNAGTEVVSDILFLQKRERAVEIEPDWIFLRENTNGQMVNGYFVDHPEMVLGKQETVSGRFGEEYTVQPFENAELSKLLEIASSQIVGEYTKAEIAVEDIPISEDTLPADPSLRDFSYAEVNGTIYFQEGSVMVRQSLNPTQTERIKGMIRIREALNDVIQCQIENYEDAYIKEKQDLLNAAYDTYTKKYGIINSRGSSMAFGQDASYYRLCSLENMQNDVFIGKADIFFKRTIRPHEAVSKVSSAADALVVSIGERAGVDMEFMCQLSGMSPEAIERDLTGIIFRDIRFPLSTEIDGNLLEQFPLVTADEYLSGNVREKLRMAEAVREILPEQYQTMLDTHIEALKQVQPIELTAPEIDVRLGVPWVDKEYFQQFMHETFKTPIYRQWRTKLEYEPMTATWNIVEPRQAGQGNLTATMTFGTNRMNAYEILENLLNQREIKVNDYFEDADGRKRAVVNKKETMLAQTKAQTIKDAFKNWIWEDPTRRNDLVKIYNERYNSTRTREYDGSHIVFAGMNPDIQLRDHQKNAIAHILYGGNTLLAHEVGAGKTYSMAAAAMESKRLGLSTKSLVVVPNHLISQWASEWLRLYPAAKLLAATENDFTPSNRKKFCARIATGDYDAIIIGHTQFEKIPLSMERQQATLQEQIDDIVESLSEYESRWRDRPRFSISQLERTKKSLEARLEKLNDTARKDDLITFEELGVDHLYVDESHMFKNLFIATKMSNVAGLSTSEAQRSNDMFMKCRYLDEVTGNRGVTFASGTAVSNSMVELYTLQRYLQYDTLKQMGLAHFDSWAAMFGETVTAVELAPEGTGYRARTRFARFTNIPELMNMFKMVADICTADQLHLPVPEAEFITAVSQSSEYQKAMIQELSKRATAIHNREVDSSEDNMLVITSDGRKIGLDQRLQNPLLPDDPDSKINRCVENMVRIWKEGAEKKLTQLAFCDMSTPTEKGGEPDAEKIGFTNVYEDMRKKLIAAGVPETEVMFIHSAKSNKQKEAIFDKVRAGDVRILFGSTQKMGAGTNCQDRLIAVHHLDVGWKPSDMAQRNGRIIRQGNQNPKVQIFQYVTNGTFDSYLYQTLENKQRFISQILTSKSPVRSCNDVDEQALSFAEVKALCAGNPMIKEKMDLDIEVARLKVLKGDYLTRRYHLEDELLKDIPLKLEQTRRGIDGLEQDIQRAKEHPLPSEGFVGMQLMGRVFQEKKVAGEVLLRLCQAIPMNQSQQIGTYRGFDVSVTLLNNASSVSLSLTGSLTHTMDVGTDVYGNIQRMDNALERLSISLLHSQQYLEELNQRRRDAEQELEKAFPYEEELTQKSARLAELDVALNMDQEELPEMELGEPSVSSEPMDAAESQNVEPMTKKKLEELLCGAGSRVSASTVIPETKQEREHRR